MRIRNLYLSIYLTVVAVLLVFALVAGVLVRHHAETERVRIEQAVAERTAAWAELIEKGLPSALAPEQEQREALLAWARRLRLAIALESPAGQRIAATELFVELEGLGRGPRMTRVPLADGRVLIVAPPRMMLRRAPPPGAQEGPDRPPGPAPSDMLPRLREEGRPRWPGPDGAPGPRFDRPPPRLQGAERGWLEDARLWGRRWFDEGTTLLTLLGVLFVAIAAGSYPVVRRLTRRLEALQHGVETFGAGDLGHRVPEDGGDEVAALAASFNQAARRVEDLVRANRSLLANASHELRSPLARLKMAVEMLEVASPEARAALKAEIANDIRELDGLVEEVLLASRLDAQPDLLDESVDLAAMAAEEAARVGAQVSVDAAATEVRLRGDERLLRRALRNLLENARRYGGDEVAVQIGRATAGGSVEVAVLDRGPGVPPGERERIFEPFHRLPGHAETAGGVGLGLSLVRQIARRHGGSVRCEAREGGGSRFVLALPAAR